MRELVIQINNNFKDVCRSLSTLSVYGNTAYQAKSTDRYKLTTNKLTANQRFCHSDFITDFVTVISSQSEGLGKKMALGIVKYFYGCPSEPISVIWFAVSLAQSVVVDPLLICHRRGLFEMESIL